MFVRSLAHYYRRTILGLQIILIAWAASALLVALFQCRLPEPWNYIGNSCMNRVCIYIQDFIFTNTLLIDEDGILDVLFVTNIFTDCGLITVMILIAWHIQTAWSKKIMVMGVFGSRIL